MNLYHTVVLALGALVVSACATPASSPQWESIFDGETLNGWTPKIAGQETGEDAGSIFQAENGVLRVSYENYDTFAGEFGHLFYDEDLSDYRLKYEYRFLREQVSGGPAWAFQNSGVMVHTQDPYSMTKEQYFPVCIEAQLLGASAEQPDRTTANICTPGTHVTIDGEFTRTHCISSKTVAAMPEVWTEFEIEVRGDTRTVLYINGEEAFRITDPVYDETDPDTQNLGASGPVTSGHFALQAESHPVEFRNIELMRLSPDAP